MTIPENKFSLSFIASSFVFVAVLVFLSEWLQKNGFANFPLGFRHIIVLLIFIIYWLRFGLKIALPVNYKKKIIILFLYILIAFSFSEASLFNYVLGIFFTFLFTILFILGINIKSSKSSILKIFDSLIIFLIIMSISPIIEVLSGQSTYRWVPTMFREIGAYAASLNIGVILSLSMYLITSRKKYLLIASFFSFGILLTILKKSIISSIIVWISFFLIQNKSLSKLKIISFSLIFIIFAYALVGNSLIDNYNENKTYLEGVGSSGHVRIGMYVASYNIAFDYFPFGSGLGTFGSLASIIGGYSNVYINYGVSEIGSNSPEDVANGHHTLLDTFWPHIIGELGIIGLILFLLVWLYPIKLAIFMVRFSNDNFIKGISFYVSLIIITITWEGFTLYTPEIPSFVLLHSGLTGLCYYHIKMKHNHKQLVTENNAVS